MTITNNREYFLKQAAAARHASVEATNPDVQAAHHELAWRYDALADLPSTTPIGMLQPGDDPRDAAVPIVLA
jgi:hypothetical protein